MNLERLKTFHRVLERAKSHKMVLDMKSWKSNPKECVTEEDLLELVHDCETTCCAAGYLCHSREWIADGGSSFCSEPTYHGYRGGSAIRDWLGISRYHRDVDWLSNLLGLSLIPVIVNFYGVENVNDINLDMVIEKIRDKISELSNIKEAV